MAFRSESTPEECLFVIQMYTYAPARWDGGSRLSEDRQWSSHWANALNWMEALLCHRHVDQDILAVALDYARSMELKMREQESDPQQIDRLQQLMATLQGLIAVQNAPIHEPEAVPERQKSLPNSLKTAPNARPQFSG